MTSLNRRQFLRAAGAAVLASAFPYASYAQEHKLVITAVEPYVLKGGKCFVLVRTDAGITGIGEVSPMNAPAAAHLIADQYGGLITGMNPLDIDRCWDRIYYATYKQGVMGLQPEALAGIDIALWDILGKVTGLPLCQLLGGKRRDWVRVYASIGGGARSTPEKMA